MTVKSAGTAALPLTATVMPAGLSFGIVTVAVRPGRAQLAGLDDTSVALHWGALLKLFAEYTMGCLKLPGTD